MKQENSKNIKAILSSFTSMTIEKSLIMISMNIEKTESEKQGQISEEQEKLINDELESEGTQLKILQYSSFFIWEKDTAQISRKNQRSNRQGMISRHFHSFLQVRLKKEVYHNKSKAKGHSQNPHNQQRQFKILIKKDFQVQLSSQQHIRKIQQLLTGKQRKLYTTASNVPAEIKITTAAADDCKHS